MSKTDKKPPKRAAAASTERKQRFSFPSGLPIWVIFLLTFWAFSPTFQNDFVNWDDDVNILQNKDLEGHFSGQQVKNIFSHTIMGGYNPLSIFTFALEKAFFGVENWAKGIHTNNLLLHLGVVFLVYRLVLHMGWTLWGAFWVSLLFAVHPMRVESVAWATERKDVLLGLFYFLSIIEYVKFLKSNAKSHLILTYIYFVLALFSKIQAVALPLTLWAFDYFFDKDLKQGLKQKIPLFLLSLAWGAVCVGLLKNAKTIQLEGDGVHFNLIERLGIAGFTYLIYLSKCIYPYIMCAVYAYPAKIPAYFYVGTLLGGISLGFVYQQYQKGNKILVLGWAFFFFNFMFVSQIVGAGQAFLADRFTYIPYFGLFVILIGFARNYFGQNSILMNGVLCLYIIICLSMTYAQTQTWQNGATLWTKALEYDAQSSLAYGNRAIYYREKKEYKKAIADFDKAIGLANKAATLNSRGKTHFDMGQNEQALSDYTSALSKDASIAEIWINRAAALGKANKFELALSDANKGLSLDSTLLNGYSMRSLIYQSLGKIPEALRDNEKYIQLKPNDADIWFETGLLRHQLNQLQPALAAFSQAIELQPERGVFYAERAKVYAALGNIQAQNQDILWAQSKGTAK